MPVFRITFKTAEGAAKTPLSRRQGRTEPTPCVYLAALAPGGEGGSAKRTHAMRVGSPLHKKEILAPGQRAVCEGFLASRRCFHHIVAHQPEQLVDLDERVLVVPTPVVAATASRATVRRIWGTKGLFRQASSRMSLSFLALSTDVMI